MQPQGCDMVATRLQWYPRALRSERQQGGDWEQKWTIKFSNMASSGGVRIIESDSRFRTELTGAKGTLIIANFKASWFVYLSFRVCLNRFVFLSCNSLVLLVQFLLFYKRSVWSGVFPIMLVQGSLSFLRKLFIFNRTYVVSKWNFSPVMCDMSHGHILTIDSYSIFNHALWYVWNHDGTINSKICLGFWNVVFKVWPMSNHCSKIPRAQFKIHISNFFGSGCWCLQGAFFIINFYYFTCNKECVVERLSFA